ncbi:importin beta-like SAD2 isoform X2 [Phoenix dactylifera]|uniref:Importin beta-like SAD2 isoform X2 n=1 Tax=Phoenix dactylifera TaxID=42345 RepID=A0A8B8ZWK8_PHODC|nr:importin beta-like SAD2 isoform X2 [Phoenix dactylifera]
METLIPEVSRLLSDTLSPENAHVSSATDGLDLLSLLPHFPISLIVIATGGDRQGLRVAAATYLKNFTRHHMEEDPSNPQLHNEFRNQLALALLQVEPTVLKVLVEAFHLIVAKDFVKEDSWPELVPELKSVIQNSNLICPSASSQWNTINALTVLKTVIRPFQYFMNPKVPKEPMPSQLELIAKDILVPLQATFRHFVDKALSLQDRIQVEFEQILLIICKCMYFAVRSYMPSALSPLLPSFCYDLFRILDSLSLDRTSSKDGSMLRLKTAKRSLIIFCTLVTRHRKHTDKLMPSIINCAFKLAKQSTCIAKLDPLSERIVSLAFDVISHILETGPGWRFVSPHFSSLLNSAIFPVLSLNQKDIVEWEEDTDEYIRKNLPSDLDEISGWAEDLFTARKSAINLLGVIAMSKGPPTVSSVSKRKKGDKSKGRQQRSVGELLVIPFLSKFPMPSDGEETSSKILSDYYGVLMAYGGLQDFLREISSEYTTTLVRNRVLPLYSLGQCSPYLIATANWVIGELASCLPQAMNADIYSSLMKTLTMPDIGNINCYPVRASAAGAIAELLENDYVPADWLTLLQVLVNGLGSEDESEASLLFQLLGTVVEAGQQNVATHIPVIVSSIAGAITKHLPPIPEPWPQVVEQGFAALAVMAQTWQDYMPDETKKQQNQEWQCGRAAIARTFSSLLQQAWLISVKPMDSAICSTLPPPSCIDDASALLGFIMQSVITLEEVKELKITELLAVWSDLIADWHAWEEIEDLAIFSSIREAVNLHRRVDYTDFFMRRMSSHISSGSTRTIIEGISAFVTEAITAYPSAMWRACSCVHALLNIPRFSFETGTVKQLITVAFTQAAFSRFKDTHNRPAGLWKPLLLAISSCYLSYPEKIKQILEKEKDNGFLLWACGLAHVSSSSFEPSLSSESEIKLAVITLAKVVEQLLGSPSDSDIKIYRDCFVSLMEACIHLKEVGQEDEEEEDGAGDIENEASDEESDDEDSEEDEREETEEEFLERYAKAADELSEMVEEGDVEYEAQELELGSLDEVDIQKTVLSLVQKHRQILIQVQALPLPYSVFQRVLSTFPEYGLLFQVS